MLQASINANTGFGTQHLHKRVPLERHANYYTLKVNNERNVNAVWFYAEPKDAAKEIKGRVAFWKGVGVVG
jgi:uncharacterized protein (DUF427 family)